MIFIVCFISFFLFPHHPAVAQTNAWQKAENAFLRAYINQKNTAKSYAALAAVDAERAATLKKQAEAVAGIFTEVLKTEKQLVPKQCNYLVIYGYENSSAELLQKAFDTVRLAVLANKDRVSMNVFVAGSKDARAALLSAIQMTGMPLERVCEISADSNRAAATKIIPLILDDIVEHHYDMANLLYRRVLLLTKASNTRVGYAAFVAALADNAYNMILDDFSTLDGARKQLDSPSRKERARAFMALKSSRASR
ncbi:MAG: hypothetical protein J6I73_00650 [Treponema sp.]|nr:hypothetical protein [Treponema sp.]